MEPAPAIWIDGEPGGALPLPDRGLDFGDGMFETLLLRQGQPLFLDLHLQRLQRGFERLDFPDLQGRIRRELEQVSPTLSSHPWCALRLTVTRGSAPRGYAPPAQASPRTIISATPLQRDCLQLAAPAALGWAQLQWSEQPALAGLKHLNRLEQVLAAREAQRAGWDEVLVCDRHDQPVSAAAGNLFIYAGGRLLTPPLEHCGIVGTRRRLLLEQWGPELGIDVIEQVLTRSQVEQADALLLTNSLQGVRPVASLGGATWSDHSLAARLHQCFVEAVA